MPSASAERRKIGGRRRSGGKKVDHFHFVLLAQSQRRRRRADCTTDGHGLPRRWDFERPDHSVSRPGAELIILGKDSIRCAIVRRIWRCRTGWYRSDLLSEVLQLIGHCTLSPCSPSRCATGISIDGRPAYLQHQSLR
nr:hypothetical protein CFP56_70411 [Quercus suber]